MQKECIWMQAGVVRRKFCRSDYDCHVCRYDHMLQRVVESNRRLMAQGIQPTGKRAGIVSWRQQLKTRPPRERPCLHYMKGRIEFRACTNDYSCADCDFDQYFDDQFAVHAAVRPVNLIDIDGFKIPQGYYLHPGHSWIRIEEAHTVRVGLDDFALRLLGPLDRIDTPLVGKQLNEGRTDMTLHRGDNSAGLVSPVNGVVTDVNARYLKGGGIESEDAYGDGWLVRVHSPGLRQSLKNLLIGTEATGYLRTEVDRLYGLIEATSGPLAADGGCLSDDLYGKLPRLDWARLTRLFLRNQ